MKILNKLLILTLLSNLTMLSAREHSNPKGYATSGVDSIVEEENYTYPKKHEKFKFTDENRPQQGIYNYSYEPDEKGDGFDGNLSKRNPFLYGNFKKVYRFEPLEFGDSDSFDEKATKTFDKIMKTIQKIEKNPDNEYLVSIIGHTREVDNKKEDIGLGSAYTNFFHSIAQYDRMDVNESKEKGADYAQYVQDKLVENNVSLGYLYIENVKGSNPLYSEGDEESRELNHRVNVAVYVKKFVDIDSDGDGVFDSKDFCPQTLKGARVDVNGCPYVMTLHLQFSFDNDVFEDEKSYKDVIKLADFMKKYPVYNATIIGHTDSTGDAKYNQKLSERRAKLVVDTLIANGIDASRLSSVGRGESEPLFKNDSKEGRFENRRTEVELTLPAKKKRSHIKLRKRGE